MSKKPLKKSEQQSEWRAKKRNKIIKEKPSYHLILCEGEKTEVGYFNGLRDEINTKYRDRIKIEILPSGKGRLALLEEAQKIVKKQSSNISKVWLVYDKDDFKSDEFDNVVNKCNRINQIEENEELGTSYYCLWSNQCIEAWFLLHFIELKADIPRSQYIKKLNEQYKLNNIDGKYRKNATDTYAILRPYLKDAIRRTKKIIEENSGIAPSKICPGSNVFKIFDEFKEYLD